MDKKTIGEEKLDAENNKTEEFIELKDVDNYEEITEEKYNKDENLEINNDNSDLDTNNDSKNFDNNSESSSSSGLFGKKMMKVILNNLNSYWIEIIASFNLIITLIIYEAIGIFLLYSLEDLIEKKSLDGLNAFLDILLNKLGLKWLTIINVADHLSVGFFCLTTFSAIFQVTLNIKKFYIWTSIEVALYYALCVIISSVFIRDGFRNYIVDAIENLDNSFVRDKKEKVIPLVDDIIDYLVNIIVDFLSTYNVFLEKFVLGSLYLFLFLEPKKLKNNPKHLLIFRLLSLIPISFIIVSLILRALQSSNIIMINEFVLSFLLGQKFTIYGFFIVTLSIIKYKAKKYNNLFDEDNTINTKIFTKIGSIIFAIFGGIELIIGLFLPSWSSIGIGIRYLIILCAPIFTLYDYKKVYVIKFPCCHKGDMSKCFKIIFYIVGYFLVIVLGLILIIATFAFIDKHISQIFELLLNGLDTIYKLLNGLLKFKDNQK